MKLVTKSDYFFIQEELKDLVDICKENDYKPTKEDVFECIEFLTEEDENFIGFKYVLESNDYTLNLIYEGVIKEFTGYRGASDYDNAKDWEALKKGTVAAGAMAGAAVLGAGAWISYLFKKRKLKKMCQKQSEMNVDKLKSYGNLLAMKKKLAELEGTEPSAIEWPTYE